MDKKVVIIIGVVFVVLLLVIVGGGFFLYSTFMGGAPEVQQEYVPDDIEVWTLTDSIMANLTTEDGTKASGNMLRVLVSFGLDTSSKDYKDFTADFVLKEVVVRDRIIKVLEQQTYARATSPDGKAEIAIQIKDSINEYFGTTIIYEVYFADYLAQ